MKESKRGTIFSFISHGFSLAFVLWMMVIVVAAGLNPNHIVINNFNALNEYWIELGLCIGLSIVIIAGFVSHYHRFKREMKK